jgi:hypothetical protein
MLTVFPEIVEPDLIALLATRVPMYDGTVAVGGGLVPPEVDHGPPHGTGGVLVGKLTFTAKPLKADGAPPPDSWLAFDHWLPHQVTVPPPAALELPTTNAP